MTCRPFFSLLVSLCVLHICLPAAVEAAIIIDVRNATIPVGGTGTVDVFVHSDGTDTFDIASYVFGITDLGATPNTDLSFVDPQSTAEAAAVGTYVFGADFSPGGMFFNVTTPIQVEGSDLTETGDPISLTTTPLLLATLDLELSPLGGTLGIGEQFLITALVDNGLPFSDLDFLATEFLDFDTPASIAADSFEPLGIGGGIITVTAATAAVPEPSSFAAVGLVACLFLGRRLSRRRNNVSL